MSSQPQKDHNLVQMLTLGFIKMILSIRDNAFSFMLMRKDSNLFLKLKSQSTELDNKNEQPYSLSGERVVKTFLSMEGQKEKSPNFLRTGLFFSP